LRLQSMSIYIFSVVVLRVFSLLTYQSAALGMPHPRSPHFINNNLVTSQPLHWTNSIRLDTCESDSSQHPSACWFISDGNVDVSDELLWAFHRCACVQRTGKCRVSFWLNRTAEKSQLTIDWSNK
jgi:hypothetical protein